MDQSAVGCNWKLDVNKCGEDISQRNKYGCDGEEQMKVPDQFSEMSELLFP